MKFYGPLTPKFTEYFACFTEWKIFARKFVGRDPPSLRKDPSYAPDGNIIS